MDMWTPIARGLVSLALAAGAVPPVPVHDEAPLAALVSEALARNPDLAALEASVAAAQARPAQARALPDPMVSLAWVNDGLGPSLGQRDMSTLGVMASQDLPWPGTRALRGRIAERAADQVVLRQQRARLSLAASVRRAYHALWQARALRQLAEDQGALWAEMEGVARARYSVGQGAQQDVLRTQIQLTRVGQVTAEQEAEEAVRLAELSRLLGREDGPAIQTPLGPAAAPAAAGPEAAVLERLRGVSPELAAAGAAVEEGRLRVQLARAGFKPDLTVQAGYMNRGGLDPMWQAGVGLTLPLSRGRRRAALAEAESELRAAEARAQAVGQQLRFRTAERLARLASIQRLVALYEQGLVPQGALAVEAATASYQAGRVPFTAVLESMGAHSDDRGALVRLLAARARVWTSVEEASLEATDDMPVLPGMGGAGPSAMGPGAAGVEPMRAGSPVGTGMSPSMKEQVP
jgi:outer membrane protein, heavy metal efflux system